MAIPPRSPFAAPSFTDPLSGPSSTPDLFGSHQSRTKTPPIPGRPSAAFIGISWLALVTATVAFPTGLYNASMSLSARGFYLTLLMYGLFSAAPCPGHRGGHGRCRDPEAAHRHLLP